LSKSRKKEEMSIRVAIVGVGNCASALVQGISVAKAAERKLEGVTYESIGDYKPESIDFVVAFDVDSRKVGRTLGEALFSPPNCCWNVAKSVNELSALPTCKVLMGPVLDGVADHMLSAKEDEGFRISAVDPLSRREAVDLLVDSGVDVLINYLPVGSQKATEWWAEVCLDAGVSFCNCIPVFIASDPTWEARFIARKLPLIGDDMRSQFGASVMSQMLQELAFDRGHKVKAHIQQNFGGNTDFLNMTDKSRLASKKISKENVIRSQDAIRNVESDGFLYAGPGDYIRHYGDNKIAIFHLELEGFGGAPVTFDAKLSVQDSPNSAGVVVDAVRFLKVAKEMGICGSLRGASAFTQKTPPEQLMFSDAKAECDALASRILTSRTKTQIPASTNPLLLTTNPVQ
jgi:myo-inositol-1-phosphate synthase